MAIGSDVVERLGGLLDELAEIDPADVGDAECVVGLHRQLERLRVVTTRATAAFDAARAWEPDGARACGACLHNHNRHRPP